MTTNDAKTYLTKREIPRLFESLMTGLMYHRPSEHLDYLITCLEKVKTEGIDSIRWNYFVDLRRTKTPLPPVTPKNGKHRRTPTPKNGRRLHTPEEVPREMTMSPVLPPIGDHNTIQKFNLPNVPIAFIMGGPGSGKLTQVQRLVTRYEGWVHLSMGDLIRHEISTRGTAEDKWGMVADLVSKGEMAPEDITIDLLTESLKKHPDAKGFILEGYPRNVRQVEEYEKHIGRVDLVFLLDCEEEYCQKRLYQRGQLEDRVDDNRNAIAKRITFFKVNTLPAIKHYDDQGKLVTLDGDRDTDEIAYELATLFDKIFYGKSDETAESKQTELKRVASPDSTTLSKARLSSPQVDGQTTPPQQARMPTPPAEKRASTPPSAGKSTQPKSGRITPEPVDSVKVADQGRQPDLPQCPIIFVAGGPGSGKGDNSRRIVEKYTKVSHISVGELLRAEIAEKGSTEERWGKIRDLVTAGDMAPEAEVLELLYSSVKEKTDASAILIDGYPRSVSQLEAFNQKIGGGGYLLLLDTEEDTLSKRLAERGQSGERTDDNLNAVHNRLSFYKNNTLAVLKHYDDSEKLVVFDGEKNSNDLSDEMSLWMEHILNGAEKPSMIKKDFGVTDKRPESATEVTEVNDVLVASDDKIVISVKDSGRKENLPQCPLIFITGGPGSGKGKHCKRVVEQDPNISHISLGDLLRAEITDKESSEERWGRIRDLVNSGNMAPESEVIEILYKAVTEKPNDSKAIIVDGFPRSVNQLELFNEKIGGGGYLLLLDAEEDTLSKRLAERGQSGERTDDNLNAVHSRLSFYKNNTLPVLKHYDDSEKLAVLNGEQDDDAMFKDISAWIDFIVYGKDKPEVIKKDFGVTEKRPESATEISEVNDVLVAPDDKIVISVKDSGRKENLPQCPLIFITGGPGSGKGKHCKKVVEQDPNVSHISLGDLLRAEIADKESSEERWGRIRDLVNSGNMAPESEVIEILYKAVTEKPNDSKAIIVDGFPRSVNQLELFNEKIGGGGYLLLLDTEEDTLSKRLAERGQSGERTDDNLNSVHNRLSFYKNNTLPVLKHYDDSEKLAVLNGEQDDDAMFNNISAWIDFIVYGKDKPDVGARPAKAVAPSQEEGKRIEIVEEVIEASFVSETVPVLGDHGNPHHSSHLDSLDTQQAVKNEEEKAEVVEEVPEPPMVSQTAPVLGDNGNPHHSKHLDSIDTHRDGSENKPEQQQQHTSETTSTVEHEFSEQSSGTSEIQEQSGKVSDIDVLQSTVVEEATLQEASDEQLSTVQESVELEQNSNETEMVSTETEQQLGSQSAVLVEETLEITLVEQQGESQGLVGIEQNSNETEMVSITETEQQLGSQSAVVVEETLEITLVEQQGESQGLVGIEQNSNETEMVSTETEQQMASQSAVVVEETLEQMSVEQSQGEEELGFNFGVVEEETSIITQQASNEQQSEGQLMVGGEQNSIKSETVSAETEQETISQRGQQNVEREQSLNETENANDETKQETRQEANSLIEQQNVNEEKASVETDQEANSIIGQQGLQIEQASANNQQEANSIIGQQNLGEENSAQQTSVELQSTVTVSSQIQQDSVVVTTMEVQQTTTTTEILVDQTSQQRVVTEVSEEAQQADTEQNQANSTNAEQNLHQNNQQNRNSEQLQAVTETQQQNSEQSQAVTETQQQNFEQYQAVTETQQQNSEQSQAVTEIQQQNSEQSQAVTESQQQNSEQSQAVTETQQQNSEQSQAVTETQQHNSEQSQAVTETQQQNSEQSQAVTETQQQNSEQSQAVTEIQQQNSAASPDDKGRAEETDIVFEQSADQQTVSSPKPTLDDQSPKVATEAEQTAVDEMHVEQETT